MIYLCINDKGLKRFTMGRLYSCIRWYDSFNKSCGENYMLYNDKSEHSSISRKRFVEIDTTTVNIMDKRRGYSGHFIRKSGTYIMISSDYKNRWVHMNDIDYVPNYKYYL